MMRLVSHAAITTNKLDLMLLGPSESGPDVDGVRCATRRQGTGIPVRYAVGVPPKAHRRRLFLNRNVRFCGEVLRWGEECLLCIAIVCTYRYNSMIVKYRAMCPFNCTSHTERQACNAMMLSGLLLFVEPAAGAVPSRAATVLDSKSRPMLT